MFILHIEHAVPDFERWKAAFDSDPIGRKAAGVRRYRVMRAGDDPSYVMIDLEFDSAEGAGRLLDGLRGLWGQIDGKLISGPTGRIAEVVDTVEY